MSPEAVIANAFRDEADRRRQRGLTAELDTSAASFAAVALTALEAAGYRVVPSYCVIPEMKLQLHFNKREPLPYVHPDLSDPMS